jgi:hypothetical protein
MASVAMLRRHCLSRVGRLLSYGTPTDARVTVGPLAAYLRLLEEGKVQR